MSFSKTVFETFGTKVITIFISMLSGVIIARYLGPHDRGLYALLVNFPVLLGTLTSLGIGTANIYFMKRESKMATPVLSNAFLLAAVTGFLTSILLFFSMPFVISTALKGMPARLYYIILFMSPFVLIESYFMNILRGMEKFGIYNARVLLYNVLTLAGVAVIFLLFKGTLLKITVFTLLLTVSVNLWLVHTVAKFIPIRFSFDFGLFKNTLRYGLKFYVQSIVNSLQYKIDIFMLAFYLNPEEVAFYTLSVGLVQLMFHLPNSVGIVLMPKLVGKEKKDAHEFTASVCRNTLFLIFLPSLLVLVLNRFLIGFLYGPEYLRASQAVPFLLPGIILMSIFKVLSRNYTASNRHQITAAAGTVGLTINVIANLILIPGMGIRGAALSTMISYSITSLIVMTHFIKDSGLGWKRIILIDRNDFYNYKTSLKQFRFFGLKS